MSRARSADWAHIVRKERSLTLKPRSRLFAPDIEAAQAFGKLTRNVCYRRATPTTIRIAQVVQQPRCRTGQCDLQMEGKCLFVDSCHVDMRTNKEQ